MYFDIIGEIEDVEVIAAGNSIKEISRLRKHYGKGHWRKMKGLADVRLPQGNIVRVELHWYESHGIGRKEFKIKRIIQRKV